MTFIDFKEKQRPWKRDYEYINLAAGFYYNQRDLLNGFIISSGPPTEPTTTDYRKWSGENWKWFVNRSEHK